MPSWTIVYWAKKPQTINGISIIIAFTDRLCDLANGTVFLFNAGVHCSLQTMDFTIQVATYKHIDWVVPKKVHIEPFYVKFRSMVRGRSCDDPVVEAWLTSCGFQTRRGRTFVHSWLVPMYVIIIHQRCSKKTWWIKKNVLEPNTCSVLYTSVTLWWKMANDLLISTYLRIIGSFT